MQKQDTIYDRIKYICEMMDKIEPGVNHTKDSKIKNAKIESLCKVYYPHMKGPYQRIRDWCESKIPKELDDIEKAAKEFQRCFELMKSRNQKYGDSWKVLSVQSVANLIEMKMHRIANLGELEAKTEDELMDTVNYGIFALLKLKK